MRDVSSRSRRIARVSCTVATCAAALLLQAADASALPCVEDKFGSKVNCTANDVRITDVTDIVVTDDGCTGVDDEVTFNATLTVVTTATERYDIGLFIGGDGVQAENGECTVAVLPTPPFPDEDGDECGDSTSAQTIEVAVTGITVDCVDANGDNELDVASCTSWQQNETDNCEGPEDVEPGTASKCNCPTVPTDVPIFVPDPVCVSNADCEELATGCNVGTCDAQNPNADAFGCIFTPTDSLCDDGLFCNGEETCEAGVCEDGTAPDCDDDVGCTNDSCDENANECVNTPDNSICDDDLFCNGVETCDATNGCQAGTAPDCDDDVGCTNDSCNEATNSCVNAPDDSICDDDLFCNGEETCDATQGCQAGTAPDCDDDVSCTNDSCNEATNACVNTPADGICDDGLFCNGAETCDETGGCQAGTAPDCDDDVGCTNDSCNEDTNQCVNAPDDSVCDDDLFCNGEEACDATGGCEAGTAPDCDDDVGCTNDSCNEATDQCVNTADDSVCDDDLFCNGEETCDATTGCEAGTPVVCDDDIVCTLDACNEAEDECISTGNDTACEDQNACTMDICVPNEGCAHEPQCENGICRSPGFWSTHGGSEKNGTNVTQEVLDAVGGIEVCGQLITDTTGTDLDSALQGLCVDVDGVQQRQLYRQLIAAALNCAISGSTDCDLTVEQHTGVSFDDCNALCAGDDVDVEIGDCVAALDCYNNGGEVIDDKCATGNCSITDALCGANYGSCPDVNDVPQECEAFEGNCHDAELCNEDIGVCVEGGPASSSRGCKQARGDECTIDDCN